MDVQVWMASKEVAERLDVHVRTLRNWLEMFVPANERQKNAQGHYLISESGVSLLQEVKERKDAGHSSLREILKELVEEGKVPAEMLNQQEIAAAESTLSLREGGKLLPDIREVELSVQETLFHFQQELTQLGSLKHMQSSILEKIAEIEDMQEALRLEMRRVAFEMDLIHQSLTRRKHRQDRYQSQSRWSLNPLRWFSRQSAPAAQKAGISNR